MALETLQLSSSLRSESAEVSLEAAKRTATRIGISRVTDITRLDRVGLPVYTSVRPRAMRGSLCVNAGKGTRHLEAKVGAYMEAIEFALAEPPAYELTIVSRTPRDFLTDNCESLGLLDFCPLFRAKLSLDDPIKAVEAVELIAKKSCFLPAELVFFPFPAGWQKFSYFGSNTNGLASGNDVLEATIHAIFEIIERDCRSFQFLRDSSRPVVLSSLPPEVHAVFTAIVSAGLQTSLRYCLTEVGVPYFSAIVVEAGTDDPKWVNTGYGCHALKEIAATRAFCEALQSRLSSIHGARDDLYTRHLQFQDWSESKKKAYLRKAHQHLSDLEEQITWTEIPDWKGSFRSLDDLIQLLLNKLQEVGFSRVCRVILSPPKCLVKVVRILIPGMEYFTHDTPRAGRRLNEYVCR